MSAASSARAASYAGCLASVAVGAALALWIRPSATTAPPIRHLVTKLDSRDLRRIEAAVSRAASRAVHDAARTALTTQAVGLGACEDRDLERDVLEGRQAETPTEGPAAEEVTKAQHASEDAVWAAQQQSERVIAGALSQGVYTQEDSASLHETTRVLSVQQQQAYFARLMDAVTAGRLSVETGGPLF